MEQYEKLYLYKRIVQAKLFIDNNFADNIDVDLIDESSDTCTDQNVLIHLMVVEFELFVEGIDLNY